MQNAIKGTDLFGAFIIRKGKNINCSGSEYAPSYLF